jgi:hypothetical protein
MAIRNSKPVIPIFISLLLANIYNLESCYFLVV